MRPKSMSLLLVGVVLTWYCSVIPATAQEQDAVAAAKKATADLTAADKVVVGARNNLAAATRALDVTQFNSAAYNAKVTTDQENAAKEKYEKIEASKTQEKEDALEVYQLAQELAAARKTAFEAAKKLLPQREAEAKAAEEKYAAALAAAEKAAAQILAFVRQTEAEAAAKSKESKLAIEKAAFTKATAEQTAATNAEIRKTMAAVVAAEKAVQQAAAAVKQASDADRSKKLTEAENATKAYATAVHAAVKHLPPFNADQTKPVFLELRIPLVEADKALQAANAALQQTNQDIKSKTDAVTRAQNRVKAAQDGVEKRIAKIRAKKDLAREQAALERAQAAKVEADKALPAKTADVQKAQQAYTAALQAAVKTLAQSSEEAAMAAEKAAIAKAMADKEAEMKKQEEALAKQTAETQAAADKAKAALAATDKALAERAATREALASIQRKRFYRNAGAAQTELRLHEAALAQANRELQPKVAAFNKATAAHKAATDALTKAQQAVTAQAIVVTNATKAKEAADKANKEKVAVKAAADQAVKDAQTALAAAQEALKKAAVENSAAVEEQAKEKEAVAKTAAEKAKAADDATKVAKAALDKTVAALTAAQTKAANTTKAAKDATQKVAAAKAALDKATADKTAGEKLVSERKAAVEAAPIKVAVAKAAAYGGLKPLDAGAWDRAKARHLMVRAGFGGTPEQVAELHAMGLHKAVSHLVHFKKHPPADVPFVAHPKQQPENYESALSSTERRRLQTERLAQDRRQIEDMRKWWLRRMIESPRPLEEKLTLFWHGQIPVQYSDVGDSYYMYLQNQLYRDNAAGNFGTLLYGVAHDAAMLKYLNNDTNIKGKANENLAREIIELFSMGRDQGYSEIDIRQGARALTGYTYDPKTGQFRFISSRHDTEPKTIFGKTGNWNGDDYVRIILETPHPPKFIARQMFMFFTHDEPSLDTIESLANVLRLNNYELTPMLENLFLSEEFYSAKAMSTEIKSPVQLVVGLHRDLGLTSPDYAYLASACRNMGQDLFEPPSVFGWQAGRTWVTTARILSRYNVLAEVLEKRPRAGKTGVDVVGTLLAGKEFKSHVEVVDYLVKCCWMVPLSEGKKQALLEQLKPLPEPAKWAAEAGTVNPRLTHVLAMLMCSPEYQLN